jgi:hypothetical protein
MSRITVTAGFLLVAGLVIWSAFTLTDPNSGTGSLLINLGTEILGIVIIIAVVEWFFEKRRALERGRLLAWNTIHAVEHVVWVWQGGPREVDTDHLLGILKAVRADDPLPDFTQNLLLGLGTRAKRTLHNDQDALKALPALMNGFEELARLNAIREGGRLFSSRKVADILEAGIEPVAKALNQPTDPMPARLIRYVDAGEAAQELRYFGGQGDEPGPRRLARPEGELA